MQRWSNRVVEEANLFNPAFCATLLAKAIDEFAKKAHQPLPFALSFLVLPVVVAAPGSAHRSALRLASFGRYLRCALGCRNPLRTLLFDAHRLFDRARVPRVASLRPPAENPMPARMLITMPMSRPSDD